MTDVVTGASGHLGACLVRALLAAGRTVRVVIRDDTRAVEGLDVERVRGSVLDPDSLDAAFAGAERVFHLAARISLGGDPDGAVRRTNVDGTRHVLEACRRAGIHRLVHVSSIHALRGHDPGGVVDDDTPLVDGPAATAYDRSKADGERLVREAAAAGFDAVIVEPTGALGPHDYKNSRTGRLLRLVSRGWMPAVVDGSFDWVDTRDVAVGLLSAAERGTAGTNYILSGHRASLAELCKRTAAAAGSRAPWFAAPMWLARLVAPLMLIWARLTGHEPLFTPEALLALRGHRRIEARRAREQLGWAPRPLERTLADTVAWFRGEPIDPT